MLREESRRPGGREEFDKKDFSCKYRALEWALESTLSEAKILCSHAELILSRAENIAVMVSFVTLLYLGRLLMQRYVDTRFNNHQKQPIHPGDK